VTCLGSVFGNCKSFTRVTLSLLPGHCQPAPLDSKLYSLDQS
jgi:hypothetical protein